MRSSQFATGRVAPCAGGIVRGYAVVCHPVNIGAAIDAKTRDGGVARPTSYVERRQTNFVSPVDDGAAVEDQASRVGVAAPTGHVERRTTPVRRRVDVRAAVEE